MQPTKEQITTLTSTTNLKTIKIASFHDLHLGHPRTPTHDIIERLKKALPFDETSAELDLIILAGDVFDRLLTLPVTGVDEIQIWVITLLSLCAKYGIVLRVLEGTPSHDWKQSCLFETLNSGYGFGVDVKHVTKLSYEYHAELGISLFYVPDEWHPDPAETYKQALRILKQNGVEQIDVIVMHGAFEYQLPPNLGIPTHSSSAWLELTRYFLFCGHVHLFSQKEKIYVAGSFDRLCHNEESPKGYIRATINLGSQTTTAMFVENTAATLYKTIDCRGLTVEDALKKVQLTTVDAPNNSWFRVLIERSDNLTLTEAVFKKEYVEYNWSVKVDNPKELTLFSTQQLLDQKYQAVDLNRENLPNLIEERLTKNGVSELLRKRVLALLEKHL